MSDLNSQYQFSDLAKKTFEVFQPYINPYDCGRKFADHPYHMLTAETKQLFARYCDGERNLTYQDGRSFNTRNYFAGILNASKVKEAISSRTQFYYTANNGGSSRKMIATLDNDLHHEGATAEEYQESKKLLFDFCGKYLYTFPTNRGGQSILKIDFSKSSAMDVIKLMNRLCEKLTLYVQSKGSKAIIEYKGKPGIGGKAGTLARLPFNLDWTWDKLKTFQELPELNAVALQEMINTLEEMTPEQPRIKVKGSTLNFPITESEIEEVPGMMDSYKEKAWHIKDWCDKIPGLKIEIQDICQYLVEQKFEKRLNGNMHYENENPVKFNESLWNVLRNNCPAFSRGYNSKRFAAIRKAIDRMKWIEWTDNKYWFYEMDDQKGKAMQWVVSDALLNLEDIKTTERDILGRSFTNWTKPQLVYPPSLPVYTGNEEVFYSSA